MSRKVADALRRKGTQIISVNQDTPVIDALKIMSDKNIGSVVVVDASGNYLGIMTERDYSRKIALKGRSSTETKSIDIISSDLPRVSPSDSIDHCMQLMSDKNIRYLPVFENSSLAGVLSINDVIKETIIAHEETITHLRDYVNSNI